MFLTLFMVGCVILGIVGPKYVERLQRHLEAKKAEEQDYRDRTLRALERTASAVPLETEVEEPSTLDCLLEGNRKILEKQRVRKAMKDELGID